MLEPLEKSGKNEFHKYKYVTAEDVLLPVQEACNSQGLFLTMDCIESIVDSGKATVTMKLTVYDAETGESLSAISPGYAEDKQDKALFKAITGASKYVVRSFFCLPSEDDPEKPGVNSQAINSARTTQQPTLAEQLRKQIGIESKRLGWQVEQIRAAAQEYVGKTSSADMTVGELQQFLNQLKSVQSPLATA